MGAGLGLLRLPPESFWAMTPRELSAALEAIFGDARMHGPFARGDLAALMARYPDKMEPGDG